ncbi:hypothetical protein KQI63_13995 [bacterium]|nr:hypothetical protein [bacterium]
MSRLNMRWLIPAVLLILLPTVTQAQEASPWSFEASVIYNQQSYGFDQVQDAIDSRVALERESMQQRTVDNLKSINEEWAAELKAGFRYNSFYLGFIYCNVPEQTVGYESYVLINGSTQWAPNEYVVTTSAREYLISAGYIQPLGHRLSVALFGSMGWGFAKGEYKDPHPPYAGPTPNGDPDDSPIDISGNYTPWRIEGRLRVALTRYIDLDMGGGWRSSVSDRMVGEYGLTVGNYPVAAYDTADPKIVEFDWSGPFYGIGLTLKNPFGD